MGRAQRRGRLGSLLLVLVMLAIPAVWGLVPGARADELDDGVRRIAKQLRCPICESVSVADSPADLAGQMRGVIRKKLEAGESESQIVGYFVAAYGDSVLLEPPRSGIGWVVWLGPLVAFVVGAALLALVLRSWIAARPVPAAAPPTVGGPGERSEPHVARAHQELEAMRERLAR